LPGRRELAVCSEEPVEWDGLEFARRRLGFEPDEKQAALLGGEHHRLILNCTRQWGKSTVTAAKVVHRAWSRAGSMILVVSPSERQSAEFLRKVAEFVRRLGVKPRGDGDQPLSILMPNGSRIVGLPGREATSRCFSAVSLLIVDEAARVSEEQYLSVKPMLATVDGDLWMMSTPWGRRGFFWEVWTAGGPEWTRVSVTAAECPRIPASFLESQRREMPERAFLREYMCDFGDEGASLFDREVLMQAIRPGVRPLWE
jgi:hypothetical protein